MRGLIKARIIMIFVILIGFISVTVQNPQASAVEYRKMKPVEVESVTSSKQNSEAIALHRKILTSVTLVSESCKYYADAYGHVPPSIDEITKEFMTIWPGNPVSGGPVKILNTKPDPNNPAHRGNVYYSLSYAQEARVQFVTIDDRNSMPSKKIWVVEEMLIKSERGTQVDSIQKMQSSLQEGETIKLLPGNKPDEFLKYYTLNLRHQFTRPVVQSLEKTHKATESFADILNNSNFYVLADGFDYMKKLITEKKISFNISTDKNNEWVFFDFGDKWVLNECIKYSPDSSDGTDFERSMFNRNDKVNIKPIITFEMIGTYEIPPKRMLKLSDINR